ncbi:hypothetical protein [Crenothrix sp.]|uniref:hypothetical protein n=1 Tax=Crenothrix sp. TaxID=3100433 RepID=UPI00374DA91C
MNRKALIPTLSYISKHESNRETAIHEAGHATAIYLGNKQRQLPDIVFQIVINRKSVPYSTSLLRRSHHEWIAKIEGGRLIHALPSFKHFTAAQKYDYRDAFEADIVNLLVGPLAEAKYVALRDDEPISPRLIPPQALHHYGGTSDLELVREYLECFITDEAERADKIAELFLMAFNFINNPVNWAAIVALADYILRVDKDRIDCEEAGFIITQQHL